MTMAKGSSMKIGKERATSLKKGMGDQGVSSAASRITW